jgi:hypothetical protein
MHAEAMKYALLTAWSASKYTQVRHGSNKQIFHMSENGLFGVVHSFINCGTGRKTAWRQPYSTNSREIIEFNRQIHAKSSNLVDTLFFYDTFTVWNIFRGC